ncbi:hypothetical protein BDZ97DRAFT_1928156 [Flammula alnicola]|nr:hypothetical protein BDZ97DRAFT_1928156 [Flammula alnicola]
MLDPDDTAMRATPSPIQRRLNAAFPCDAPVSPRQTKRARIEPPQVPTSAFSIRLGRVKTAQSSKGKSSVGVSLIKLRLGTVVIKGLIETSEDTSLVPSSFSKLQRAMGKCDITKLEYFNDLLNDLREKPTSTARRAPDIFKCIAAKEARIPLSALPSRNLIYLIYARSLPSSSRKIQTSVYMMAILNSFVNDNLKS